MFAFLASLFSLLQDINFRAMKTEQTTFTKKRDQRHTTFIQYNPNKHYKSAKERNAAFCAVILKISRLGWSDLNSMVLNMNKNAKHCGHIKIQSVKPHLKMVRGAHVHKWSINVKSIFIAGHIKRCCISILSGTTNKSCVELVSILLEFRTQNGNLLFLSCPEYKKRFILWNKKNKKRYFSTMSIIKMLDFTYTVMPPPKKWCRGNFQSNISYGDLHWQEPVWRASSQQESEEAWNDYAHANGKLQLKPKNIFSHIYQLNSLMF